MTVDIKLVPRDKNNPTYEVTANILPHRIDDVVHDTYDYTLKSTGYEDITGTVIVEGSEYVQVEMISKELEPVITWVTRSRTRSVPYSTVVQEDSSLLPSEGYTTAGENGVETQTYELQYQDGQPTSIERNHSTWTITKAVKNEIQVIGTKSETAPVLTSILTQPNIGVTYATNTYVNGTRTTNDLVPLNGTFEMRQWDNPSGGLTIDDGDLEPNKPYTLALTMESVGTTIETAHFIIGMAYFGGEHFFNGTKVTINPSVGQYNFKPHLPNSGKVTYYYQFYSEPDTPTGDYFQVNVDNTANSTRLRVSEVGLYNGHINPFV